MINQMFGGNMLRMNPIQMLQQLRQNPVLQQLRQNPVKILRQAGMNVPENLTDPNQIIQHLMNSGQVSQERYNQARQMAAQFKR